MGFIEREDFRKKGKNPRISKYGLQLSTRTMMILEEILSGKTNLEIGKKLKIDEKTVKYHVTKIYDEPTLRKRGIQSRPRLLIFLFDKARGNG